MLRGVKKLIGFISTTFVTNNNVLIGKRQLKFALTTTTTSSPLSSSYSLENNIIAGDRRSWKNSRIGSKLGNSMEDTNNIEENCDSSNNKIKAIDSILLGVVSSIFCFEDSDDGGDGRYYGSSRAELIQRNAIKSLLEMERMAKQHNISSTCKENPANTMVQQQQQRHYNISQHQNQEQERLQKQANFTDTQLELVYAANYHAASSLRLLVSHYGTSGGKGREALRSIMNVIGDNPVAVILLVSALALNDPDSNDKKSTKTTNTDIDELKQQQRSISRAVASAALQYRSGPNHKKKISGKIILPLLQYVVDNSAKRDEKTSEPNNNIASVSVDFHIVTSLIRAFDIDTAPLMTTAAKVINDAFLLPSDDAMDNDTVDRNGLWMYEDKLPTSEGFAKEYLALAAQVAPWSSSASVSAVTLVRIAFTLNLLHAAERICISIIDHAATINNSSNGGGRLTRSATNKSNLWLDQQVYTTVHALIDCTYDAHMYKQADVYATKFYDSGGIDRYAEARLRHACDTIEKVILKRQFPIIERQVDRVDKAFERVRLDNKSNKKVKIISEEEKEGMEEIRTLALRRLREVNENDAARRYAKLWGIEYHYSAEDAAREDAERKKRYLQWEDAYGEALSVPELISEPNQLRQLFCRHFEDSKVVGFDVEWGEDCCGAALLQLATNKQVILIDIPALSMACGDEGVFALKETVGGLFSGSRPVVGFACRQDLSRLRKSPCCHTDVHWMDSGTQAVIELKPIIAIDSSILKDLGLSRVCQSYFGKQLDKAEQCSIWSKRPLSLEQRIYAALDAWACAAIYDHLVVKGSL